MDPEHKDNESQKKDPDSCPDPSHIFQSTGLRRFIRSCDEVDRVLLGYGWNFLLPFSAFLWLVFLAFG
jgi:hypothetical protein